jgi:AcrR family transcriptional regulator
VSQRRPSSSAAASRDRARSTADRILDAAEDCFARKGFDGTTLRDVADIVGIRIPSLYNHFDGKQALYGAVLSRGMTPILDLLGRSLAESARGDVGTVDPRATVAEVMALLRERPNLPRLVQYEMLAGGEHLSFVLQDWVRPALERSLEMLHDTPAAIYWKPEQLPYLLLALLNVIIGHFTMTPLIDQLLGERPESEAVVTRATEFYGEVAAILTAGPGPARPASAVAPGVATPPAPPSGSDVSDPDEEPHP